MNGQTAFQSRHETHLRNETRKLQAQIDGLQSALSDKHNFIELAERALYDGDAAAQMALIESFRAQLSAIEGLLNHVIAKAEKLGVDKVLEFKPLEQSLTKDRTVDDLEIRLYRTHAKWHPRATANVAIHHEKKNTTVRRVVQLKPINCYIVK